ncbi:MAG: hypothetical protein IIW31_01675 [Clostridia bacterium]|nr:hypothetical protein [Clostridia bacterium]
MNAVKPTFSLLYLTPEREKAERYDDALMKFIGPFAKEPEENRILTEILSRKTSRRDAEYRMEILQDLMRSPALFGALETICRKWEELKPVAKREISPEEGWSSEAAVEALQANTISLMEHLHFLRRSAEILADKPAESRGMFRFIQWLNRHANGDEEKALVEQIGNYPLLRADATRAVVRINLDKNGAKTSADLAYLGADEGKFLKKYPIKREDFTAEIPNTDADATATEAINRLSEDFRMLTKGIRDSFLPLKEGLAFYQFALSMTEYAHNENLPCDFALPVQKRGPEGKRIRRWDGALQRAMSPVNCTARALEAYEGERGTEILRTVAQTQIFASAGLPTLGEEVFFCPEETILLYSSEAKTVQEEIAALAQTYHNTRKNYIVLLNQPLITVGVSPATEIVENLLKAFHKKGASVRLATDLSVQ